MHTNEESDDTNTIQIVQCMPLYSLLAAIKVTTVDYFSLDVEGNELEVLKTIPFDKIYIRVSHNLQLNIYLSNC